MRYSDPKIAAFILVATDHGPLIVNRLDFHAQGNTAYGVGGQLLQTSMYQSEEVGLVANVLLQRRQMFGDGVVALDCGANIGVFTVEWARFMTGWGKVIAIEAQERLYYALAGNIALNNCSNATAIFGAVSYRSGTLGVPVPDYEKPGSYGSLELRKNPNNEYIGQKIDYDKQVLIRQLSIDDLMLPRVDFIKMDVQRMEMEALEGAKETIKRDHPMMLIEKVRVSELLLWKWLEQYNYVIVYEDAENVLVK